MVDETSQILGWQIPIWVVDLIKHVWNGMRLEITPVDAKGINGLLVLSTATLAIAQYIDNNHSNFFKKKKIEVEAKTLPLPDDLPSDEAKIICRALRKQQESLCNTQPVSLRWLIRILLFLLPYYACMYAGMYTCPDSTEWLQVCFKLGSLGVVGMVLFMLVWIKKASTKEKKYEKEFKTYMNLAGPLSVFHDTVDKYIPQSHKKPLPKIKR